MERERKERDLVNDGDIEERASVCNTVWRESDARRGVLEEEREREIKERGMREEERKKEKERVVMKGSLEVSSSLSLSHFRVCNMLV